MDRSDRRRTIVALTGGIGAGKSTAAAAFAARGAVVVDVDRLGRVAAEVGGPAHDAIVERFGADVVREGRLDRAALASKVFGHPDELAALNAISHPAINELLAAEVAAAPSDAIVIFDQAVLVESDVLGRWGAGPEDGYQDVIVVEAPLDVRVQRLIEHRGMNAEDAAARISSQVSDDARRAVATWIIDNGSTTESLEREVDRVWNELTGGKQ
ncbi:MAG: dephospho-CoA kinase [Ilumatobacteraceae bacterium]